jgi:peptide/nickel transport system ATP-binding protein
MVPAAPDDLLSVQDLQIRIAGVNVVDGVSLSAQAGRVLAIVGESGCGKSLTALAIMQLLPKAAQRVGGRICLDGEDLTEMSERALQKVRGNRVSIIFQEPIASLNPLMRVGAQVEEALTIHRGLSGVEARAPRLPCWRKWAFPTRNCARTSLRSNSQAACANAS